MIGKKVHTEPLNESTLSIIGQTSFLKYDLRKSKGKKPGYNKQKLLKLIQKQQIGQLTELALKSVQKQSKIDMLD